MEKIPIWVWAAGAGAALLLIPAAAVASAPPSTPPDPKKPSPTPAPPQVSPGKLATYLPTITRAVYRHPEFSTLGRSRPEAPLVGLLWQESRLDPSAVSPTGAVGIGQFTTIGRQEVQRLMGLSTYANRYPDVPGIASKLAVLSKADVLIADVGIEAAALLLASLIKKWSGDIEAALTDYNAGGVAAKIVHQKGSHAAALADLKALPSNVRSQSPEYAPKVLAAASRFDQGTLA